MKLRTAIAVTLIVAQAVALLGTTGTVSAVLSRAARVELTEALMRDRSAFLSLLSYRRALQHAESRIIADEPRLKAIAATDDVSRETVVEMVSGALVHSGATVAVAVTGIAGPGGGSEDKPVGTVWIGWKRRGGYAHAEVFHFDGDRDAVRRQTVAAALHGLERVLG